ncbi:MAG: hypothetical protein RAP70_08075 [Candidatus Celaenobacter antarcticus]|nr:hypothetical protein [Candidatus Celaenobacter antarcticus]
MEFQDVVASPTLAKMYEEQGKYAMALIMYKKLNEKKKDEFYEKKITYLEEIITSKTRKAHDEIGSFVMSDSEKDVFNISKDEDEKTQTPAEEKSEEPQEKTEKSQLDAILKKSSTDISYLVMDKYADITVEQFFSLLASMIGKNRKLDEITLMDVLQAIERI